MFIIWKMVENYVVLQFVTLRDQYEIIEDTHQIMGNVYDFLMRDYI